MGFPRSERPHEQRVLLVVTAIMVSKRWLEGKPGNFLLAMPQARSSMDRNFILQNSRITFGGAYPGRRAPAVWLTNREMNRSYPERWRGSLV
jgi:hypothetical protein